MFIKTPKLGKWWISLFGFFCCCCQISRFHLLCWSGRKQSRWGPSVPLQTPRTGLFPQSCVSRSFPSLLLFMWSLRSVGLYSRLAVLPAWLLIYGTSPGATIYLSEWSLTFPPLFFLYSSFYFYCWALKSNIWLLFHKEINWHIKEKSTTITASTFPSETTPKLPYSAEWITVTTEPGWKLLMTIFYHEDIFVKIKMCPRKIPNLKKFHLE